MPFAFVHDSDGRSFGRVLAQSVNLFARNQLTYACSCDKRGRTAQRWSHLQRRFQYVRSPSTLCRGLGVHVPQFFDLLKVGLFIPGFHLQEAGNGYLVALVFKSPVSVELVTRNRPSRWPVSSAPLPLRQMDSAWSTHRIMSPSPLLFAQLAPAFGFSACHIPAGRRIRPCGYIARTGHIPRKTGVPSPHNRP